MTTRVRITVSGKVQGVFFRQNTQEIATTLGLVGWVENTDNGEVKIEATGTREQLEKLISWCKVGSPRSQVENVRYTWEHNNINKEVFEHQTGFTIRR